MYSWSSDKTSVLNNSVALRLFSSVITRRNNIPFMCLPTQAAVIMCNLFWLDGRSDYVSLPAVRFCQCDRIWILTMYVRKSLHPLMFIIRLWSYATHAQLKLDYFMFVWIKSQMSFDRRSPEMSLTTAFVLASLFCSPLAAGWHRSCGGSLDNHMISFCTSSRGSGTTNRHNGVNPFLYKVTTHLLRHSTNTSLYQKPFF